MENTPTQFCTICQDNIQSLQVSTKLDCGDIFHFGCINTQLKYIRGKLQCPNCRTTTKDELVPFTPGTSINFDVNLDALETDMTAAAMILSKNQHENSVKNKKRKNIKQNVPLGNRCVDLNSKLVCKKCNQKLEKSRFSNTQLKLNSKFGKKISCITCHINTQTQTTMLDL